MGLNFVHDDQAVKGLLPLIVSSESKDMHAHVHRKFKYLSFLHESLLVKELKCPCSIFTRGLPNQKTWAFMFAISLRTQLFHTRVNQGI